MEPSENPISRQFDSGSRAHASSPCHLLPKILIHEEDIARRVKDLGFLISAHYQDLENPLLVLVVLEGAMLFAADLVRSITIPFEMSSIQAKSYTQGHRSAHLKIAEPGIAVVERTILIIEDIVDSGNTMRALFDKLAAQGAQSITAVTLLSKRPKLTKWAGFYIDDEFVYGYGLDDADGTGRGDKNIWVKGLD